tara:strand:- start:108 stop:680 length:573 start_codon:yes stop_codon:yes gene_type:complete
MINHEHKFIFIHIPKTAGSSIEDFFIDRLSLKRKDHVYWDDKNHQWAQHYTLAELGSHKYKYYFKFAFVRNPWDRVVSACMYRKSSIRNFLMHNHAKNIEGKRDPARHQMPQHEFLVDIYGKHRADFVGRFENLQTDFNHVCDRIGIERGKLPHSNKTKHKHYSHYYNKDTRGLVAKRYARDIEYFGYEF